VEWRVRRDRKRVANDTKTTKDPFSRIMLNPRRLALFWVVHRRAVKHVQAACVAKL